MAAGSKDRSPCRWAAVLPIAAALLALIPARAVAADYQHFAWQEVAGGVWFGTTRAGSFQTGNSVIISLPSGGALVVDSHNADFLAREIIDKAKAVSGGPVRYLVNTHLHQDHMGGNHAFRREFPEVQILAHQNTCTTIPQKTVPRMQERLAPMRQQLTDMRARRTTLPDGDKDTAGLDRRIAGTELYLKDAEDFHWFMPTACLDLKPGDAETIADGARRVEIRYFGRAHTTGDLVVFLPAEKILAMADLWAENSGDGLVDSGLDGRDGSVLEGPLTQRAIRNLDFEIALPGHTGVMRGKAALDAAIATGERMIGQIKDAAARGDNVEDALQRIPPPANASAFTTARWRRIVIRGFEEIELRRQLGLALPE